MIRPPAVLLTVLLLVMLSACSSSRKVTLPEPSVVDRSQGGVVESPSASSVSRIQRILTLLDEADRAFAEKRLTTPDNNNAWSFYSRVLKLQPSNQEAKQGMDRIVQRYIQWSKSARSQGREDRAQSYLQRAIRVNPSYPGLKALFKTPVPTASPEQKDDTRIVLSSAGVKSRSTAVQRQLLDIADKIKANNARVIIEAPNDATGRWLYQQLNQRHEDYRIRANMQKKPKPAVRLLY